MVAEHCEHLGDGGQVEPAETDASRARASDYIAEKVQTGLQVLAIDWPVAAVVERLPFHHRDPFDRLIIAQAQAEHLDVVTKDKVFRKYGVKVVW